MYSLFFFVKIFKIDIKPKGVLVKTGNNNVEHEYIMVLQLTVVIYQEYRKYLLF